MHFDPAIAAHQKFQEAINNHELGEWEEEILEAEDTFSSQTGEKARSAYLKLQEIGEQLPHAKTFQEFLIYITWQQVTEETIPQHFQKGVALCQGFLKKFGNDVVGTETHDHITAILSSFKAGLGEEDHAIPEFEEDAFKGGD